MTRINKRIGELTNDQLIKHVKQHFCKKIGVLVGGGDAPGGNAVLQGILDKAEAAQYLVVPFKYGFSGIVQDPPVLSDALWGSPLNLVTEGGVVIGCSRVLPANVFLDSNGTIVENEEYAVKKENRESFVHEAVSLLDLEGLIVSGGNDTLSAANSLNKEGINVVGIPKSIDEDCGEVYPYGRHTAVENAVRIIDSLRTTGDSHGRDLVVEVMGSKCGKIALDTGIATHADAILIPEFPFSYKRLFEVLNCKRRKGQRYNIIVVAEGAVPEDCSNTRNDKKQGDSDKNLDISSNLNSPAGSSSGSTGKQVAEMLSANYVESGFGDNMVRSQKIGYYHRSGNPSETDRIRGYKYGVGAMELAISERWGFLIGYANGAYAVKPLETAANIRHINIEEYNPERCNARLSVVKEGVVKD